MPKPENPEGPATIKVGDIPSDVRRKMWLLKRINAILGGPTEYKKMVIEEGASVTIVGRLVIIENVRDETAAAQIYNELMRVLGLFSV